MEISLFTKYIKDLIVERDKVEVPGLGTFIAELMPASFSDKRTTINPPYRNFIFRKGEVSKKEGAPLVSEIAQGEGLTFAQASSELNERVNEIIQVLNSEKSYSFPEFGTMRATSQNDYIFVADDDLDIFPEELGLEPIYVKILSTDNPTQSDTPKIDKKDMKNPKTKDDSFLNDFDFSFDDADDKDSQPVSIWRRSKRSSFDEDDISDQHVRTAEERKAEKERIEAEKAEAKRLQEEEKARIEAEKRAEKERIEAEKAEAKRLQEEEKARIEAEKRAEKERIEAEKKAEKERIAAEKAEAKSKKDDGGWDFDFDEPTLPTAATPKGMDHFFDDDDETISHGRMRLFHKKEGNSNSYLLKDRPLWLKVLAAIIVIVIILVLLIIILYLLKDKLPIANDIFMWFDHIADLLLYSKEELELLGR